MSQSVFKCFYNNSYFISWEIICLTNFIYLIKNISESGNIVIKHEEPKTLTKVVDYDYITNGEYLIVGSTPCKITLDSNENKKIKIKSLTGLEIIPDIGLIDGRWKSISLDGDSCIELVFVSDLNYCESE